MSTRTRPDRKIWFFFFMNTNLKRLRGTEYDRCLWQMKGVRLWRSGQNRSALQADKRFWEPQEAWGSSYGFKSRLSHQDSVAKRLLSYFFILFSKRLKGTWSLRGWDALIKQSGGLFLASKSEVGYRMRSIGSTRSQDLRSKAVSRLSHQDSVAKRLLSYFFIPLLLQWQSTNLYRDF